MTPDPERPVSSDAQASPPPGGAQTAASLERLEDTLDTALDDLAKHNRQVEDYLSFLKQERLRELRGPETQQMTFDDAPPSEAPPPDPGSPE